MTNYEQILSDIRADARYRQNLDWGEPRKGHPEGSVRHHIEDLEGNLAGLRSKLTDDECWKLRVLIHTHDTFKAEAARGVAISDPQSHASLARQFLAGYTDDPELLKIVQLHDEPYALWKKHQVAGDYSQRLEQLLSTITNWDLFLAFLIIDGCTPGKSRAPLTWFLVQIRDRVNSRVTEEWIVSSR